MPDVPEGAEVLPDVDLEIDDGHVAQNENIIAPLYPKMIKLSQ